jgi:predicted porin
VANVDQVFPLVTGFDANAPASPVVNVAKLTGDSFTASPSSNRVETMRWGVAGRITHRLWRNTSLYGQFAYNEQDSKSNTLGGFSDFDGYLASLGIRHEFEPLKVW